MQSHIVEMEGATPTIREKSPTNPKGSKEVKNPYVEEN